jgi:hypothetical protein
MRCGSCRLSFDLLRLYLRVLYDSIALSPSLNRIFQGILVDIRVSLIHINFSHTNNSASAININNDEGTTPQIRQAPKNASLLRMLRADRAVVA